MRKIRVYLRYYWLRLIGKKVILFGDSNSERFKVICLEASK